MKYEITYLYRGEEFTVEVDADNQYQAVSNLTQGLIRWYSCRKSTNGIEILTVRTVEEYHELVLNRTYLTNEGKIVVMKKIHNEGKEHETMSDQHGHHRYSRSQGRVVGRSTGSPLNGPNSITLGVFWTKKED